MSKMKLIILEQDNYFIEMMSSYIRTSEHADTFSLTVFTVQEQGFAYVASYQEPYILLVHESFMPLPEHVYYHRHGCLIILSDVPASADIVEYPVLCKYQPLNQLLSHMVSHYNEYTSNRVIKGNRSARLIAVYSAVGGTGKTLTAVHLARELTFKGKRAFYLSLEQLPSASWLESAEGEDNCFSRMLYYGKAGSKLQTARLERYKRRHRVMGFDFFPGASEPAEMTEMTEKDTESLLKALIESGAYDCIVIDLDSTLHPRVTASLKLCDELIWLVIDDRIHLEKAKQQLRYLTEGGILTETELNQKLKLVATKSVGSKNGRGLALKQPITGYLPYIPEWKAVTSMEALQIRGPFSESLAALPSCQASGGDAHVAG